MASQFQEGLLEPSTLSDKMSTGCKNTGEERAGGQLQRASPMGGMCV